MTTEPCRIYLDGWRLAMLRRGKKYHRVTTIDGITRRVPLTVAMKPVDEETGKKLLERLEGK